MLLVPLAPNNVESSGYGYYKLSLTSPLSPTQDPKLPSLPQFKETVARPSSPPLPPLSASIDPSDGASNLEEGKALQRKPSAPLAGGRYIGLRSSRPNVVVGVDPEICMAEGGHWSRCFACWRRLGRGTGWLIQFFEPFSVQSSPSREPSPAVEVSKLTLLLGSVPSDHARF